MDKLPKVYVNRISKDLRNSQEITKVDENHTLSLDEVFNPKVYQFNHKYAILLNNGKEIRSSIISNYGSKILTIDNDLINIHEIKSIKEIKK